ncbi:MAG: PPC domain-containing DNA-binding protein [Thermoguttaceae bacterium]|jgi:predicted DNA-binding protein with PD1-like motif
MSIVNRRDFLARTAGCAAATLLLGSETAGASDQSSANGVPSPLDSGKDLPESAVLSNGDVKTHLLVFRTGQEVMKGLRAFAQKHKLAAGYVSGIGAISDAVIGYFDPETNIYLRNHEKGQAELLSLTGNLALYNNEPFFHVHVALGLREGTARGGHLFEATVRPTVEVVLTTLSTPVHRKIDRATGLPLLNL